MKVLQAALSLSSVMALLLVSAWGIRSAASRARSGTLEAPFAVSRERARERGPGMSLTVLISIILAIVTGAGLSLMIFGRRVSWPVFAVSELPVLQCYLAAIGADVELARRGRQVPFALVGATATVVAFAFALGGGLIWA